jgi:hypothetical protein
MQVLVWWYQCLSFSGLNETSPWQIPISRLSCCDVASLRIAFRCSLGSGGSIGLASSSLYNRPSVNFRRIARISQTSTETVYRLGNLNLKEFNVEWIYRIMRELLCAHSVTARIFTAREGAVQHCQVGNAALARQEIVRWLSRFHPGMAIPESAAAAAA